MLRQRCEGISLLACIYVLLTSLHHAYADVLRARPRPGFPNMCSERSHAAYVAEGENATCSLRYPQHAASLCYPQHAASLGGPES